MKGFSKILLVGGLAATLALSTITPAYAAPADDAAKLAKFIAKGLKGLSGMSAIARARFLSKAIGTRLTYKVGGVDAVRASIIAQAIHDASVEYGLDISARMAADATRVVWALTEGTVVTVTTADGRTATFTVVADGGALTGEEDPVSAG